VFIIVSRAQNGATLTASQNPHRHATEDAAVEEARRLVEVSPTREFFVLKPVKVVSRPPAPSAVVRDYQAPIEIED